MDAYIKIRNPFPISLYLVEKQHMRQCLYYLLGVELAESVIRSRVPFILPDVSYTAPVWICSVFILYWMDRNSLPSLSPFCNIKVVVYTKLVARSNLVSLFGEETVREILAMPTLFIYHIVVRHQVYIRIFVWFDDVLDAICIPSIILTWRS